MNEFDRLISRGDHLLELGRPRDAIVEFQRALGVAPDAPLALCYMAYAFLQLEAYDASLKWSARAIASDPDDEWPHRIRAHAHLGKNQRKQAYETATQAVALQPENIHGLALLGDCALVLERYEEARMLGELIRRQAPESALGHRLLAVLAEVTEKHDEAAAHFEKVLELEPDDADALSSLARIRNRDNRYAESVDLLRGALSVDPTREDRQGHFRETLKRFALFGEPNLRRKSVGGLLVGIFLAYLACSLVAVRLLGPTSWLPGIVVYGLAPVMLLAMPLLRARFFSSQAVQIQLLQANLARMARRRIVLATVVAVLTAYAIAAIIYRDGGNPWVFAMPLIIAAWGFWVYMVAITLRLASLWLSDRWHAARGRAAGPGASRVPLILWVSTAIALIAILVGLGTSSGAAWQVCFFASVFSAIGFYRRAPAFTSLAVALAGLGLLIAHHLSDAATEVAELGNFGIVVLCTGAFGLILSGAREIHASRQRRRIARLLGQRHSSG